MDTRRLLHRPRAQAGFTVLELAIVIVLMGLVIVPLLQYSVSSVGASRVQQTQAALEKARDALIAFAAANGGCLPFATDFEGGYPDTGLTGVGGHDDIGARTNNNRAGDLPWADLGLTNAFLDGNGLRIQYYVAAPYTDNNGNANDGINCRAGYRGLEYHSNVDYKGQTGPNGAVYVYYGSGANRRLYLITGDYFAGTVPPEEALSNSKVADVTDPLPASLLEVRRGPDVTAVGSESDAVSARNVFVLIAPGANRNADLDRHYVRDSTHVENPAGDAWPIQNVTSSVDDNIFSMTPNVDTADSGNNGDDALLVISFLQFKSRLKRYGLNMEPICDGTC